MVFQEYKVNLDERWRYEKSKEGYRGTKRTARRVRQLPTEKKTGQLPDSIGMLLSFYVFTLHLRSIPTWSRKRWNERWERNRRFEGGARFTLSTSRISVSCCCCRLVTNFQETNRQQETHARSVNLRLSRSIPVLGWFPGSTRPGVTEERG